MRSSSRSPSEKCRGQRPPNTSVPRERTNHRFFLARSGTQRGKDAATAGYGDTYVDIECKHYALGASPVTRDLAGGLTEAIAASDGRLDLWLLVTTGAVGSAQAETLRQAAEQRTVAVEIFDWQRLSFQSSASCAQSFQTPFWPLSPTATNISIRSDAI